MRRGFPVITLSMLLCLSTGTVLAKDPVKIPDEQPKNFAAVQQGLKTITDALQTVQCGGFNLQQSVAGKIARVSGVPGRDSIWNGAPLSGMATRADSNGDGNSNNDYIFPDNTVGLTTACQSDKSDITKTVWREGGSFPGQIIQVAITYPHPKFEDPSCRWRVKDSAGSFADSAPSVPLDDHTPPLTFDQLTDGPDLRTPPGDRQSPDLCVQFCGYINSWQYRDCLNPQPATDPVTGAAYVTCPNFENGSSGWGNKYLCTDQKVTDAASACTPGSAEPGNSRVCIGGSCRCQQDGGPTPGNGCMANPAPTPDTSPVYYSYFRNYTGSFTRDAVPSDGPADDTTRNNVPVACYGFYDEFDPKFHQTQPQDRRCVINVDVSTMRASQMGKGTYGQSTNMDDIDPITPANQRPAKDAWYQKLGWGFSLLDEQTFQEKYDNNLSTIYLDSDAMDRAKITGSWPQDRPGQNPRLATSDALRAFDDTGANRIIVSWWQKQQTEAATLLHPTMVRLLMPPGYAFGADPTDPVFTSGTGSTATGATDLNSQRSKRIDVQIGATEDTLGDAVGAIERSLILRVQEEPVPALVPMGSPTEYRSLAQQWCAWFMRRSGLSSCASAPAAVLDVINKLNTYADAIEYIRTIRAELASYAGKVMQLQASLTKPMSNWMTKNLATYQEYLIQQQKIAKLISPNWRDTQLAMTKFQDQTNLPWCMNQRFESQVFPLLDDWMPSRKGDGLMTGDGLPNLTVPRQRDLLIDFSGINYMTGAIMLPVLKPVQVRLALPSPPDPQDDAVITNPLPALPSMDPVRQAIENAVKKLPKIQTGATYPPLSLPVLDPAQIDADNTTILQIKDIVTQMSNRYDAFWQSIGPLSTQNPDTSRDGIPTMKSKEECKTWDDGTCQHVEMDLREEFQRIGSRKLVFLQEDYASSGALRVTPGACQPMDQVCLLLHGERTASGYIWQITPPKTMPDMGSEARSAVRDATLPDPVGGIDATQFPPYDTNINTLLPFFDVPRPINLKPTP